MFLRLAAVAAPLAALAVTGCITVDNDSGGAWVRYRCSDGRAIEARYDNSDAANPRAELVIRGRRISFYSLRSASGARYGTENGLRGGHGLVWWTRGNEATLYETLLDDRARPSDQRPIATCVT